MALQQPAAVGAYGKFRWQIKPCILLTRSVYYTSFVLWCIPWVTPHGNNNMCSVSYMLILNYVYTVHECESIKAWHSYFRVEIASQYELILLSGLLACLLCKP